MERERIRVLVVGGGVGSLAVAAFVRQSGYRVTRVEEPVARSAGVIVAANGARMLSLLGRDLLAKGVVSTGLVVRDHRGEQVGSETESGATGIAREALMAALRTAAPGIEERTAKVAALAPSGASVRVTHGDEAEYDLVVVADGARSRVRTLAFADQPVTDAPFSMVSFLTREGAGDTISGRILGDGATASHASIGSARFVRAVVSSQSSEIDVAAVRDALGPAAVPLFAATIEGSLRVERLVEKLWPRWSAGSVLLVGDAAHPLHPLLDQAPSMTIEDGRALQVALDRSDSVAEAIAAFERMRRERVTAVHTSSWALAKAGEKRSGFAASFRGVLHRLAPSLWPKQSASSILGAGAELDELVTHRPDLAPVTPEARHFLSFLVKIGQVDGRFDEAERAFVRGSLQETGHYATDEEIARIEDEVRKRMPREIVQPFKSRPLELREQLLHAGVLLAAASGRIASDEHKALREAAHELDVPPDTLAKLVSQAISRP